MPPWLPIHFTGGHVACDLVNTVGDRVDPSLHEERLGDSSRVATWCRSAGLIQPSAVETLGGVDDVLLAAPVRQLREAAWEALSAAAEGRPVPGRALARVLAMAADGVAGEAVTAGPEHALPGRGAAASSPGALVGLLALHVADALFRLPAARLRICPRCGWLFHDSSKGGRRRWCSMSTCGNREKAGRHRHAQKRAGPGPTE